LEVCRRLIADRDGKRKICGRRSSIRAGRRQTDADQRGQYQPGARFALSDAGASVRQLGLLAVVQSGALRSDNVAPLSKSTGSRLLIAAGQVAGGADALPDGVRLLIESADEILVIAPSLPRRFEWLASATDKAREEADERLKAVLAEVSEAGAFARGMVAADDPLLAFEDAVAAFGPTHILIGLRSADHAGWQERGLVDDVIGRFGVPVTVFQFKDA
jgi:hypothetical protein